MHEKITWGRVSSAGQKVERFCGLRRLPSGQTPKTSETALFTRIVHKSG